MFRCDSKKANWYIERNLALLIDENKIQLNFVPKGNGNNNELFYLVQKQNRCVVCGSEKELTRHHAVPYCFRRHFSESLKSRSAHDVVPLCVTCHNYYEPYAWELKKSLAIQYEVSLDFGSDFYKKKDEKAHAIKISKVLLKNNKIPIDRKLELLELIEEFLGKKKEEIQDLDLINFVNENENKLKSRRKHVFGKEILSKVENISEFIKMWRIHFLDIMKPKFMPELWDVNHRLSNVEKSET